MLDALASLLYPPACWSCGTSIARQSDGLCAACAVVPLGERCGRCAEPQGPGAGGGDCANCRGRALPFRHVAALGRYEGGLARAIRRAKFAGETAAWGWLGARLAEEAARQPWAGEIDAVVPVPSTWRARRARGFNPAALLAERVARRLGRPCRAWLRRPGPAVPQVGLGRAARLANAAGAFAPSRRARPRGLALLLVDDVMTTGATLAACAEALAAGGARSVDLAVAGR